VRIVRLERPPPRFPTNVSGEDLRRALETRLDGRLGDETEVEAA